jgi:hypothetical protein
MWSCWSTQLLQYLLFLHELVQVLLPPNNISKAISQAEGTTNENCHYAMTSTAVRECQAASLCPCSISSNRETESGFFAAVVVQNCDDIHKTCNRHYHVDKREYYANVTTWNVDVEAYGHDKTEPKCPTPTEQVVKYQTVS